MWDVLKLSFGSTIAIASLTWLVGGVVAIFASVLGLIGCAMNKSVREEWPTRLGTLVAGAISAPLAWFIGGLGVGLVKEAIRSLSS